MEAKDREAFLGYLKKIGVSNGSIIMIKNHMNCSYAFMDASNIAEKELCECDQNVTKEYRHPEETECGFCGLKLP